MNLIDAKKILSPITRDGEKVYPVLTNDWTLSINNRWSGASRVILHSELLNQNINIGSTSDFLQENIFDEGLSLDKDKIIGMYAYSTQGFISENDFMEAENLIEMNRSQVFLRPSELIEGYIYRSDVDIYYIALGNLQETVILYNNESYIKDHNHLESKNKDIYLAKINYNKYADNGTIEVLPENYLVKKSSAIKLLEEVDSIKHNELIDLKYKAIQFKSYKNPIPLIHKQLFPADVKNFNNRIILFENNYYLKKHPISRNRLDDAIPLTILDNFIPSDKVGYKRIKNIEDITDFLLNDSQDEITDFLFDEKYYFQTFPENDIIELIFT